MTCPEHFDSPAQNAMTNHCFTWLFHANPQWREWASVSRIFRTYIRDKQVRRLNVRRTLVLLNARVVELFSLDVEVDFIGTDRCQPVVGLHRHGRARIDTTG
jgi:hypothetical protein